MKKVLVAMMVAIGLISSAFVSACDAGGAAGNFNTSGEIKNTTQVGTVQKNGKILTVTQRKGGADDNAHQSNLKYDPNDREWVGDPETWAQLEQVVREAFQIECAADLPENLDRTEELKTDLEKYYSSGSGELQKRQMILEGEARIAPTGAVTWSGITKMDFKGMSVQDGEATVIVDIWIKLQGRAITEDTPDSAMQHTLTLKLENDRWLITKDQGVRIPGSYSP